MKQKNRYFRHSKISEAKFRRLVKCFALDLSATATAELLKMSVRSVNTIFIRIRVRMTEQCEMEGPFKGIVELDESYFGPKRVKGKRGRGASEKTIVFGILKRNDRVYTEIVPDASKATLQAVIRGHVELDSVINTDSWKSYDGLVDVGYSKHFRVRHRDNEFASGTNHINGIESFWSYAKQRLAKLRGIRKEHFYYHLKECEFRFNHRHEDLYQVLLKLLREHPLELSAS